MLARNQCRRHTTSTVAYTQTGSSAQSRQCPAWWWWFCCCCFVFLCVLFIGRLQVDRSLNSNTRTVSFIVTSSYLSADNSPSSTSRSSILSLSLSLSFLFLFLSSSLCRPYYCIDPGLHQRHPPLAMSLQPGHSQPPVTHTHRHTHTQFFDIFSIYIFGGFIFLLGRGWVWLPSPLPSTNPPR